MEEPIFLWKHSNESAKKKAKIPIAYIFKKSQYDIKEPLSVTIIQQNETWLFLILPNVS